MTTNRSPTQLVAPIAPRLPSPTTEYSQQQMDQLNNALRSYFTQVDSTQSALLGPSGARFLDFPYGVFYSEENQVAADTVTAYPIRFATLREATGVTVASDTRLTVQYPGLYRFVVTIQFKNLDSPARDVDVWIRQNGTNVEATNHIITVQTGQERRAIEYSIQLETDDYVEVLWRTSDVDVSLGYTAAQTTPDRPATPSAYVVVEFLSAINETRAEEWEGPPAPAPVPAPPPPAPPPPNPPAPPPPAPTPVGEDANVQAIFDGLTAGQTGAWWYPAYDDDRWENADGTGSHTSNAFGRLTDHSGNGFDLVFQAENYPLYRSDATPREWGEIYSHPATVALGGASLGFCACFAVRFLSGTYNTLFSDVTGSAATSSTGYLLRFAEGTLTFSVGAGTARTSVALTGLVDGAAATDYVFLAWHDLSANTLNLQKNDETPVSISCNTVNAGSSALQVFSNPSADFSLGGWEGWDHLYGRFYGGLVFKNTSLTADERQDLVYWGATQAGIDLEDISQPPAPPPPAPAPVPAPPPSSGMPTITNMARHPHDWLKIGNYMIEDNRWGANPTNGKLPIPEGTQAYQFSQTVERHLTVGPNGEIGWRMQWRWPFFDQNGVEIATSSLFEEVKCYPAAIYGNKPGYYGPDMWPAWDFAVRLPDGATVPSPDPAWTPAPIQAEWQPLGGSVSTVAPSGSSGGNLPQQLPLNELWANFRYNLNTTPTGIGHLSFDVWLQETADQGEGFTSASITHEIMVPIRVWGNYGATHTEGGPWSKDPTNYSHDVAIGGVVYKVYVWKDKPTSPITGEFTPNQYWPGLQYNFGGLNGSFTNEETGQPRRGWKFIVFEAQNIVTQHHPQDASGFVRVDLAGIINHLTTRRDSRNIPYVRGSEYCVSVELGCEVVAGEGDITVYDYSIGSAAAAPAPTPAPPPGPPPGPSPITPGPSTATFDRPDGSISIVDHGAVAGGFDCEAAIWAATDAALATTEKIVWFPPGVWHWSAFALEARGVQYVGAGYTQTTLYADDWEWASIFLKDDGAAVKQMTLTGTAAPSRQANWERTKICTFGATNFTVKDCWIENAPAASIQTQKSGGASGTPAANGYIGYNRIKDSLSDSIHMTAGVSNMLVEHNVISGSGDDGIACVSYNGDGTPVKNVQARHNVITGNVNGRGMSVLGGEDILYYNNWVEGNAVRAGMYVAQESFWDTFRCLRIKLENNTVKDCGDVTFASSHTAILMFSDGASSGGSTTNDDLWLLRNDIIQTGAWASIDGVRVYGPQTNVKLDQNRYTGSGTLFWDDSGGATQITVNTPYSSGSIGYVQPTSSSPPAPAPAPTPSNAPFYPFGSRLDLVSGTSYPFGTMPSNYTAAQMDQRVVNCYNAWKNNGILRRAPAFTTHPSSVLGGGVTITDGYFIRFGNGGTVSEGIGYGMLITVIMAGYDPEAQNIFNGLYKVARARPAYGMGTSGWQYLMDWKLDASMNSAGGGYNAADGDMDIAQALLMAHRQWGSTGAINYLADAVAAINAMKAANFQGGIMYMPQNVSRTSDYMIGHYRSWKKFTGDTFWDTARTASAAQITNIITKFSGTAKLVPDFIYLPYGNAQPSPGNLVEGPWEGRYGPNACRCPWRWGTDYIYSGDSTWGTFARDITTWIKNDCGGNPFNASPEFHLNGSPFGTHRYFAEGVVGPAMVGSMTSTNHQDFLNTLFTAHSDNFASTDYYDAELELIPLIVASGNWWNP